MSDGSFNIGGLAKAADVPTSTVRFYERRGLLRPDGRSRANYRVYGEASLDRVRFIRTAHDAGFTLADIGRLLVELDGGSDTCTHVQTLIAGRLEKVAEQIRRLDHARGVLTDWLAACRRAARSGRCVVLEGLATREPPQPATGSDPRKKSHKSP